MTPLVTLTAAGLSVTLNSRSDGLLVGPTSAITPEIAAFIRDHKPDLINTLLLRQAHAEICAGAAMCHCGARGEHRKLDGTWLCDEHGAQWLTEIWPPVDATAATARCHALAEQGALTVQA